MHSFRLSVVGNLAKDPEVSGNGHKTFARICIVGNDYNGKEQDGTAREVVTTAWMVAFGGIGDAIAKNARKGDQLIIEAHLRSNIWMKNGEKQYDYSMIIDSFKFGAPGKAKREAYRDRSLADEVDAHTVDVSDEEPQVATA